MRFIDGVIVHCSASSRGTAKDILHWHTDPKPRGNGWSRIGYHYVIERDGKVVSTLPLDTIGIHAKGYNTSSIGICLIGKNGLYTMEQVISLRSLLQALKANFNLTNAQIIGHYEVAVDPSKTCPDFNVHDFTGGMGI